MNLKVWVRMIWYTRSRCDGAWCVVGVVGLSTLMRQISPESATCHSSILHCRLWWRWWRIFWLQLMVQASKVAAGGDVPVMVCKTFAFGLQRWPIGGVRHEELRDAVVSYHRGIGWSSRQIMRCLRWTRTDQSWDSMRPFHSFIRRELPRQFHIIRQRNAGRQTVVAVTSSTDPLVGPQQVTQHRTTTVRRRDKKLKCSSQ